MKRIGMIMVIFISSIAVMTGCGDDGSKKRIWPLADSDALNETDANNNTTNTFQGPATVEATDAEYKDKVGINWSTIDKAVSYNVYRSDKIGGPFIEKIGSVDADDLKNADSAVVTTTTPASTDPGTVTTTATGGTCDNPVYQATYQSARDIGDGIKIPYTTKIWLPVVGWTYSSEHYSVRLQLGSVIDTVVEFIGKDFWRGGSTWTQSMIVAEFNNAMGGYGTCYPVTVNGKRYIKIVSSYSITLSSDYDLPGNILWVGLDFLDENSDSSTVISSEPVLVACNDITAPTVSKVSPVNGATDIALNAKVSVAFSESIDPATMTGSSFTLAAGETPVAGTVSNTGIFTPSEALAPSTEYTATITTAVTDLAGNHLAFDYVWKFTTCAVSSVAYYYVDNDVTQGGIYYYVITAIDADGNESVMPTLGEEGSTRANDNVPSKVLSCSASKGLAGGITVTWETAANATYYRVYRVDSSSNQVQMGGDLTGTTYTDTTVDAGVYSYKVTPCNAYGVGGSSDLVQGYRALNDDREFFDLVYAEEESGLGRISHLKKTGMDMLGTETVYDLVGNGNCYYNAGYDLWSGTATVIITFTNFCDIMLTMNGTVTTVANSSQNGTITGTLTSSGIYPGTVVFNLTLTGGTASGGSYRVTQTGGSETTIPYDYVP